MRKRFKKSLEAARFEVAMLKIRAKRRGEKFAFAIAWRLPKWLVYFASLRMIAHASTNEHSSTNVVDLTAMDALKRWETT